MIGRMAGHMYTGMARGAGRVLSNPVGGFAAFGLGVAHMTHDPIERSYPDHMMRESTKTAADLPADLATFYGGAKLGSMGAIAMGAARGGAIAGGVGMAAGIALSLGMYMTGLNPGAAVQKFFDKADMEFSKSRNAGLAPIQKNKRTMAAMNQGMMLLRQSRTGNSRSLGNEAMYMHN